MAMPNLEPVDFATLGFSPLFVSYVAGRKNIGARFPGDPFDLDTSVAVAEALKARDYPREELVRRLVDYNQELGAGEATLRNIDALKKPGTFVVCTGQQPTVLLGPLFTIYKVISCLALARRLSAHAEDLTFIPMFWCASEDHDLEEMNHIHLPGPEGEVLRLKIDLLNDGRPAEQVRVDDAIRRILVSAVETLPDSEFKEEVVALFEPEPRDTLGTWFNRILLSLFSDDGLVVLEPHLLRDLSAPVIEAELEGANESARILAEAGAKLAKMNFAPAFDGKRKVHCFYIGDNRRARIKYYADFCILGEDRVDRREIPFHLQEHPERFSPDAALRPVVQGAVLPVTTYVAGPGEVAYYAQLKELHKHFGVPMPVIYPRASVTLIEGFVSRAIEKYGLAVDRLFVGEAEREAILEGTSRGQELAASLEKHIEETAKHLDALESEVSEFDPGVSRVVRKIHGRIDRDLNYLKRRVANAIDEAAGVGRRQLSKLFANTYPKELPQERVYNVLHYLVKYGPDLPRGLLQSLGEGSREHLVYRLGTFGSLGASAPETAGAEAPEEAGDLAEADAASFDPESPTPENEPSGEETPAREEESPEAPSEEPSEENRVADDEGEPRAEGEALPDAETEDRDEPREIGRDLPF